MSVPTGAAPAVPFHRLARLRPQWSAPAKPVLTILAALAAYVVLASVLLVGVILALALVPGVNVALGVTSGDPASPLDVLLALAMGALWLPAGWVGVRIGGWRPLGPTWSVAAGVRRSILRSLGPWAGAGGLVVVAAAALAGGVSAALGDPAAALAAEPVASAPPLQLLGVVLLVAVLAPIQAAGLELTLRGALLQALGTWLRTPALPVLAATAVALIGRQGTAAVLVPALTLAFVSALLAWKSGGLEISIALVTVVTAGSMILSALLAGTAAGAGAAALSAAAAAPGTSAAALPAPALVAGSASLSGGITAAVVLLLLAAALLAGISRSAGVRLLEPVGRPADEPAPAVVPI